MKRLRALTKERGAKSALADKIGITPQCLSDWMSGRFEPGGEATLRLLEWVTAADAKQKKDAGAVAAAPARKAQTKKATSNEKLSPSQRRR